MRKFNKNKEASSVFVVIAILVLMVFVLSACGGQNPIPVEARAIFELDRVMIDGQQADISESGYADSRLIFVGEERGGNVIIRVDGNNVQASINPSRDHPSYESGYWHHHLYAGVTASGSPRINFVEMLPHLGIDDNPDATDNTQSIYQRGNLHYIVETGEFRLRFTIGGVIHDLIFVQS